MGKIQKFVQVLKLNGFDNFQDFELISATDTHLHVKNIKEDVEYFMHVEAKEKYYTIEKIEPEEIEDYISNLKEEGWETKEIDEELLNKLNLLSDKEEIVEGEEINEEVVVIDEEEVKKPRGWALKKEFVDSEGNVYYKGILQPELKGTLPPTEF